ncbi:hypothetical protein FAES_2467 [Fibrella aestuarina BUZ 2]|uniref:Uncharacterized protein n=1 Tax=Fibrella aestuarina BUZ 2 TaxID=1166018 RepID=I0K8M3_9BACT|nr:hypothetical protein FAES_2467 [Fibrella aestuarina BUZ 2]
MKRKKIIGFLRFAKTTYRVDDRYVHSFAYASSYRRTY